MILADSSVWIEHLRRNDAHLAALLLQEQILIHSMVIGELACGSLANRQAVLWRWQRLPRLSPVNDERAIQFIEERQLMSRGIGFIDVHLLAAVAAKKGTRLWSRDKKLAGLAKELGLAFDPGAAVR